MIHLMVLPDMFKVSRRMRLRSLQKLELAKLPLTRVQELGQPLLVVMALPGTEESMAHMALKNV